MLAEELKPPDDESRRRAVPLSFIAGWRTYVHARRWLIVQKHSWDGVFEAAVCGFVCALPILAPGIVTQPAKAPPYILVYGGLGAIIGLIVGLVLRTTALLTLRLSRRVAAGVIDYPQP